MLRDLSNRRVTRRYILLTVISLIHSLLLWTNSQIFFIKVEKEECPYIGINSSLYKTKIQTKTNSFWPLGPFFFCKPFFLTKDVLFPFRTMRRVSPQRSGGKLSKMLEWECNIIRLKTKTNQLLRWTTNALIPH